MSVPTAQLFSREVTAHFLLRGPPFQPWWPHNLADNLSKAGRHRDAEALLPDLRELAATHGSAQDRVRLDWVEGRVAAGLGDHDRACRVLTQVRQTFVEEGNAFDAALAALDLSISRDLEVSREPMAAVLLFQEAAHRDAATAELAREVAASIRARRDEPKRP